VVLLAGCSLPGVQAVPEVRDRESHPLESFPDTSFAPIDPLGQDGRVSAHPGSGDALPLSLTAVVLTDKPDTNLIEDELLRLINESRAESGASPLAMEDSMRRGARIRSSEIQEAFSHTRPNGTEYYTVFDESGFAYSGKWHGENACIVSVPASQIGRYDEKRIAQMMYETLSKSAGHSRNMQRTQYAQAGIGVALRASGDQIIVTSAQLFASR